MVEAIYEYLRSVYVDRINEQCEAGLDFEYGDLAVVERCDGRSGA